MNIEIERKFLLKNDHWRREVIKSTPLCQGYLSLTGTTVRVRLAGAQAYLTIKGRPSGLARAEFEYPIPVADAQIILKEMSAAMPVSKIRHLVPAGSGLCWEIDEYLEQNAPLVTAEIELPAEDTTFEVPEWLGEEVTGNGRYTNRALSRFPFSTWPVANEKQ